MSKRKHREHPWEPFDATWLLRLARIRMPDDYELQEAISRIAFARRNSCCDDRICGYAFVGEEHPDPTRREWRRVTGEILQGTDFSPYGRDVVIDIMEDGEIGAIEFV
jgi:hypothetical protein